MKQAYFVGYDAVGDYLSNCGFIRHLTKNYDRIYIPSHLCEYLKILFNDNDKIIPIEFTHFDRMLDNYDEIDYFDVQIWPTIKGYTPRKDIGPHLINGNFFSPQNKYGSFDKEVDDNASSFYSHLGLDINIRLDEFHYNRLSDREKSVFDGLNLNNEEYAVVVEYDDILIDRKSIKSDKIINLHFLAPNILDLITTIENASEIHLPYCSITSMVYHLQYKGLMESKQVNFYTKIRNLRHPGTYEYDEFVNNMMRRPQLDNWNFI